MDDIRGGPTAAARDPQLFEEFYRRHVDAVTSFVARRVADVHTVADLTAEVFLAVLDSAHTYRPGRGGERAWLYGIARNVVASERRRTARETAREVRVSGRRLLESDDIARLEDKLDAESPGRRALAALERLPDGERAVVELVVVDQLTVTEAAAALGIRQVTARVRLHRARKALRAEADTAVPDRQRGTALSYAMGGAGGPGGVGRGGNGPARGVRGVRGAEGSGGEA
ncbi:RNA polymerase sigma factor [Streptomyces sp. S.PNR 29]|uniref:RNA polymerase sigma factor n=1 Tax=Streptomyces sp. S.PNR 29 TaxID=2973805 RepID=UPI0025B05DD4|nr:RNA polymerase sigma factor [Streptomyces sp. S.PNR 29]MDN0198110.1 RNA polymerase sigma factor [Streptomyces sp. S.PNR 29]